MWNADAKSPTPITDEELLPKLRAGDDAAYETFVRQYTGRMLAVARRLLRNEEDAIDAVQEAFISAFRKIDTFQGSSKLATWMHRIVVNASLMRLRKLKSQREHPIDELLPKFKDDGHAVHPARPWKDSAVAQAEREETKVWIRNQIDELPDTYRSVLLLRDIEGMDTEETAGVLGVNTNVVKTRLHRARQALRTLLDRRLGEAD
jgi:RNA polymerase sigma-70 factor (ECF subfamily)